MMSFFKSLLMVIVCIFLNACDKSDAGGRERERVIKKYTNEYSKFLTLNGMEVHYRDEGIVNDNVDTVVLLHGTASSLHTWDQWTEGLKNTYRVIRLDLPGFGLTGPEPHERYEVTDDVEFLHAFLGELSLSRVHLVGSSLGGRIAWQYSLEFPQQVSSLSLINSLGYPQKNWPPAIEMAQWPIMDTLIANISPRFMFNIGLKEIYHDSEMVSEALVDRYYELAHFPGNMAAFPMRVKAKLDLDSDAITRIKTPTLILWGEEDIYFPVLRAYQFQQDIKGAQLVTYPQVGHLPMEEVALQSLNDFKQFVSTLD